MATYMLVTKVDTYIRTEVKERYHQNVVLTVLKYLGSDRQLVSQMHIDVKRPEGCTISRWVCVDTVEPLNGFIEAKISTDGEGVPAQVFIGGYWCDVTSVDNLI